MTNADDRVAGVRIAELEAENARLTAQVAAGRKLREGIDRDMMKAPRPGFCPMRSLLAVHSAALAYDAATAPADEDDEDDEDDALAAYAEDMGAPADADPMNAMNAHSERIKQPVPLDPFRREWIRETEGILAKHEQRLDALAARIDVSDKRSEILRQDVDVIERKQQAFSLADDTTIVEIEHRLLALEAARQEPPQPPPSEPVVTDAAYGAAIRTWWDVQNDELSLEQRIRKALEAAFAAWDRKEK